MLAGFFSILLRRQPSTGTMMRTKPSHNQHKLLGVGILLLAVASSLLTPAATFSAEKVSPSALSKVVTEQGDDLAALDSNASAMTLFLSKISPSLGLQDASGILGAKGLSSQMTKELGLDEMVQSTHELMVALTTWHLAESIYHVPSPSSSTEPLPSVPSSAQQEWLESTGRLPGLPNFLRLLTEQSPGDASPTSPHTPRTDLLLAAHQLASDAQDLALDAWWSIAGWKDRVRQTRGLARLCGTWQWTLHNHQNHREQKMAMLFPPPGIVGSDIPLPAETIVLGDSIYLRWERNGYVQEDSLLFVKEGHKKGGPKDILRIEGSFVNNTGGWGSIVGKRTADCQS